MYIFDWTQILRDFIKPENIYTVLKVIIISNLTWNLSWRFNFNIKILYRSMWYTFDTYQ